MIQSVICTCIELEARAQTSIRWSFGAGLISATDRFRRRRRNAAWGWIQRTLHSA